MNIMNFISKTSYVIRDEGIKFYLWRVKKTLSSNIKRKLFSHDKENYEKWKKLEDIYLGKRVFLIGNGPSLNKTPLHLLKGEITMCFNRFDLMTDRIGWNPTMYAVSDHRVANNTSEIINLASIAAYSSEVIKYKID